MRIVGGVGLGVGFSLAGDGMLFCVLPAAFGELGLSPLAVGAVLAAGLWSQLLVHDEVMRRIQTTIAGLPPCLAAGVMLTARGGTQAPGRPAPFHPPAS